MTTLKVAAACAVLILASIFTADARGGLICGVTQMHHYGLHDPDLKLARNWLRFPRTSAQPGAVVVFSRGHDGIHGHVARIQSVMNNCTAVVTDEKGTYTRDICHRQLGIVMPGAEYAYSAKSHRRGRGYSGVRYAQAYQPVDRLSVH